MLVACLAAFARMAWVLLDACASSDNLAGGPALVRLKRKVSHPCVCASHVPEVGAASDSGCCDLYYINVW